MKKIALALAALALVTGCPQPPPLISLFTVAPNDIVAGNKATLVFIAVEGTTLSIDNGVGDVTGMTQVDVTPDATTLYTLTAAKDGKSMSASVTVNVTGVQPPALITLFTAAPAAISAGSSTTLVFTGVPGASLSIDNGVGDVTGRTQVDVTPDGTTTYTLTAVKDGRTATSAATVTVGATPAVGFAVTGFTSATAGVPGTVTITAVNAGGAPIATYRGTVHFTSDDAQATLPADVTFAAGDSGRKTVDVTFRTAGARLLIASDTASASAQGFGRIVVGPGPTDALAISAATTSVAAGDGVAITVTARDAYGNQATGYGGALQIATGDPLASAPGTVSFGPGDQGRKTFGVSFGQAGSWTVTATDTVNGTLTASTASIAVGPAAPSVLALGGGGAATAGVASQVTLAVRDRFGNAVTGFTGTVSFTSSDPGATVPAPYTFVPGDSGARQFDVTFTTAGTQQVSAGSGGLGATGHFTVSPAAPSALAISSNSASVTAGDGVAITITARDPFGNQATSYGGAVQIATGDPLATTPGTVSFGPGDQGRKTFGVSFGQAGSWTVTATDAANGSLTAVTPPIAVGPGAIDHFVLAGPPDITADAPATFTATVQDRFGNVLTAYPGTVHVTHDDPAAPPVPDAGFANGVATFNVTFFTAGYRTITVTPASGGGQVGTIFITVRPGIATHYALSALPGSAQAGDPIALTITALDVRDNVVRNYSQLARVTSTDATDQLPPDTGFNLGVATVSLSFVRTGSHFVTVSEVGGAITAGSTTTSVGPAAASQLALTGGGAATAGAPGSFTITAWDRFGNVATGFTGTVSFSSTDPGATIPPPYAFVAGDAGAHAFTATFRTAGTQQLTAAATGFSTVGHYTVSPAAASQCALTGVAAAAVAGAQLVPMVTFQDPFNNVATGYTGTVTVTTSAANAILPPPAALGPGDAGSRAFLMQILSAGTASVTASDGAITCSVNVSVSPGAPRHLVTFAPQVNASWTASGTVAVMDIYNNPITNYAGVLHFTSTDAAGVPPADITLTGGEGGVAAFSFLFNTAGLQTLTVTDPASVVAAGATAVQVRGLTYTNPSPGAGKMRVVLNVAGSTSSTVRLDVVSNTFTARVQSLGRIRGGVFSTGLNLPLNTGRVVAGTPLLAEPTTLIIPTGAAPKAVAATLATSGPAAGQLLVALSGKRSGAGSVIDDNGMVVGSLVYSLRLRIAQNATVGTVFDGTSLPATFRAAIRSINGDDIVGQEGFTLGKLEVQ